MEANSDRAELLAHARSFGAVATAYAEHRPDYAAEAVEWAVAPVRDRVGLRAGLRVLDLAAGTGKLTARLVAAGLDVVAVEPDGDMRAELAARLPAVPALAGAAERIPLPDNTVDAVLVGQAWHWFDVELAVPEIARVLRPRGVLAPMWNVPDDRGRAWVAGFAAVADLPVRSRSEAADRPFAHPLFEPFEVAEFAHRQRRTAESLVATVGTHSDSLVRSPADRAAKLARVLEYLRGVPETADGEFDLPIVTVVQRGRLR